MEICGHSNMTRYPILNITIFGGIRRTMDCLTTNQKVGCSNHSGRTTKTNKINRLQD